jgi:alpha-tubulin suppressor-like RCC1 family protein
MAIGGYADTNAYWATSGCRALYVLLAWLFTSISADVQAQLPLENIVHVAAGDRHTCALSSRGTVWCWGRNEFGQLGDGTRLDQTSAIPVNGLSGVTAIAAGAFHTCAVIAGEVSCWGWNDYGQIGDGTTTDRTGPTKIDGLSGVVAITAGALHTCAITSGGGGVVLGPQPRWSAWERRAKVAYNSDGDHRTLGCFYNCGGGSPYLRHHNWWSGVVLGPEY